MCKERHERAGKPSVRVVSGVRWGGALGSRNGSQLLGEHQLPAVMRRLQRSQTMMHISRRSTRCFGREIVFPLLI